MSHLKKYAEKDLNPYAETSDIEKHIEPTGNIYKSLVVVSKRANQIGQNLKEELHNKLSEFSLMGDSLDEVVENREQIEISRYYEKLPNPVVLAKSEFLNGEIYFRMPEANDDLAKQPETEDQ